ncbi:putative E3 ubiquitin-protein ligase HERC3 [Platysternon megacephalum]|uniref:Putative E3 ubiquitin-protein ligase HERC3 n=1 Tax=Platysternon megacephalum TaxID=55544 RepID=A0A4D9EB36_9SAUR|nr:putative E3 ubiquitin-protein ligase HERC3 [Platysternon megacephalum]
MWQVLQLGAAPTEEKIQSQEGGFRFLADTCAFRCLVIYTALITLASPLETRCTLDLCLPHAPHQLTRPTIQLGDQERCHQLRTGVCAPLDPPVLNGTWHQAQKGMLSV